MSKITLYLIIALLTVIASCTKENIEPEAPEDSISGRKIRYSIMVVDGSSNVNKAITIDSAKVSLVLNDSIYTKTIDPTGIVSFDYLFAGNAVVKVSCEGFTTANYIVDLTAKPDTANIYDSSNLRIVSSIISIFPTAGSGTAKISGRAFAELDLTNTEPETVPDKTKIYAKINVAAIKEYITHSASGGILQFYYEGVNKDTTTNEFGDYEITIPASLNGLPVIISADDFVFNQQITATQTQRKIYKLEPDTINVFSGSSKINDLNFN